MIKQFVQPIIGIHGFIEHIYENIDFLDMIQPKRCMEKPHEQYKFHIGCPNCRLCNMESLKFYVKHKLADIKPQTIGYKPHFKNPCFYCLSSFHISKFEDGHFNIQKNYKLGKNCVTCQRNFTMERSFYHTCNICNASFRNCKLLVHHSIRIHNSKKPHQCTACNLHLSDEVSLSHHLLKHKQPINIILRNLKYKKIDSLDLIEPKKFTGNRCQQSKFCIGCPNCRLSNGQNLEYYFKHKLEDLKLQMLDYKPHFEKQCFNCSSSYNCSLFEDGILNLQKIPEIVQKCITCQRNYTKERSFLHNCNVCSLSFKNCVLLAGHRRKEHCLKKAYQCTVCQVSLANGSMKVHICKHTLPHLCPYCNKRYAREAYLKLHISRVCNPNSKKKLKFNSLPKNLNDKQANDISHKCIVCNKNFTSFYNLKAHECIDNSRIDLICNLCTKMFSNKKSLSNHMLSHTGVKPFPCPYCPKKFRLRTSLYRHRFEHSNGGEFKCNMCDKSFAKGFMLNEHKYAHMEKNFQCFYCPKQFKRKKSLDYHMFDHTGAKQFQCDICDKSFAKQFLLTQHKLNHVERTMQCEYCPKKFKTKPGLDLHLFVKHTGCKDFKCDVCDKTFAKKYMLMRHKRVHVDKVIRMEKLFQCKYCLKKYKLKRSLDMHIFEHTGGKEFKCDLCDKAFAKQFLLNRHKLIHVTKSYQCKYCPNEYKVKHSLNVHQFEHFGGKQFKCNLCDKVYAKQYMLNRHTRIHMEKLNTVPINDEHYNNSII